MPYLQNDSHDTSSFVGIGVDIPVLPQTIDMPRAVKHMFCYFLNISLPCWKFYIGFILKVIEFEKLL